MFLQEIKDQIQGDILAYCCLFFITLGMFGFLFNDPSH